MSEKKNTKSKGYLSRKKQSNNGGGKARKKMNEKDKRMLAIMITAIVVLVVIVIILVARLVNASIFKEKIDDGSGSYAGEWTDIDIRTPEDLNDGRVQKKNVYTFVCCGIDIDEFRADTIMLVTLDMNTKRADVMHVLRDTYIKSRGRDYKINSFYARKKSAGIRQIIYDRMGIYPNYYVTLNFEALRNIVDIIDGVEVEVPFDMKYSDSTQGLHINLKAGKQLLDGDKAEQYVRYRKGSGGDGSDESRQKRQEQFLTAFMQKCIDTFADSPSKAVDALTKIIEHMKTNLSIAELTTFAHYGMEIGVDNLYFHTLPGEFKYANRVCYYQAYPAKTLKLLNEYFNPYEKKLTSRHVNFDELVERLSSSSEESSSKEEESSVDSSSSEESASSEEKSSSLDEPLSSSSSEEPESSEESSQE